MVTLWRQVEQTACRQGRRRDECDNGALWVRNEQLKLKCHWTKKINNILNIFTFFETCSMDREMEALVKRVVEVFLTFEPGANICNFRSLWKDYSFHRPLCWFKLTFGSGNLKESVEGKSNLFKINVFVLCFSPQQIRGLPWVIQNTERWQVTRVSSWSITSHIFLFVSHFCYKFL